MNNASLYATLSLRSETVEHRYEEGEREREREVGGKREKGRSERSSE